MEEITKLKMKEILLTSDYIGRTGVLREPLSGLNIDQQVRVVTVRQDPNCLRLLISGVSDGPCLRWVDANDVLFDEVTEKN